MNPTANRICTSVRDELCGIGSVVHVVAAAGVAVLVVIPHPQRLSRAIRPSSAVARHTLAMPAIAHLSRPTFVPAWTDAAEADALAVSLQAIADRLVRPLAAAADAFTREQGWTELGYARASDYARERLDRSSRWLTRLAALGRVVADCPRLADAVTGDDGGERIGTVKALAIASVATPEGVSRWIERARAVTVRELERDVRRARLALRRATGAERRRVLCDPRPADDPADDGTNDAESRRVTVRVAMPRPARAAFDEALDLFRALTGGERTVTAFVEALVAESRAGTGPGHDVGLDTPAGAADDVEQRVAERSEGAIHRHPAATVSGRDDGPTSPDGRSDRPRGRTGSVVGESPRAESAFDEPRRTACSAAAPFRAGREPGCEESGAATVTGTPGHDGQCTVDAIGREGRAAPFTGTPERDGRCAAQAVGREGRAALLQARSLVRRAAHLFATAGSGDAGELDRQLRALVALEDELRRSQARLLLSMREARLFGSRAGRGPLPYDSVGHYARARLGVSRDAAERLVRLARGVRRYGALADAYEDGRVTTTAASLVLRAIGRGGVDGATETAWVDRAERSTVRRLRDEVRLVVRERGADAVDPSPAPLDDAAWYRSLLREPGRTFETIALLAADACRTSQPWTGLFLRLPESLVEDFRAALDSARRTIAFERREARGDSSRVPGEPLSGSQGLAPPSPIGAAPWEGLVRLLLQFAATHDPRSGPGKRRGRRVYERDGYRCAAPGCTSRTNLEDHHVTYRSRGGGDELANRITLCRFHHQRGEHGGLISVRGRAPLDLVFRLGRGRTARRYRNDLGAIPLPARTASRTPRATWPATCRSRGERLRHL